MKTVEFHLVPESNFGTPVKGDTLFGHLCWQFARDPGLLGCSLSELLAAYETDPFLIVSTAFPAFMVDGKRKLVLRRPPGAGFFAQAPVAGNKAAAERKAIDERKERKKRVFEVVSASQPFPIMDQDPWRGEASRHICSKAYRTGHPEATPGQERFPSPQLHFPFVRNNWYRTVGTVLDRRNLFSTGVAFGGVHWYPRGVGD